MTNHSQLLSPAVKSRLINHRCSNETLSIYKENKSKLIRETHIDVDDNDDDSNEMLRSDLDSRSYLTWKNFNYTPAHAAAKHRNTFDRKINLDKEINQLKQKFRNQYVCEDFTCKTDLDADDNENTFRIEPFEFQNPSNSFSTPGTPLLYSNTLPK